MLGSIEQLNGSLGLYLPKMELILEEEYNDDLKKGRGLVILRLILYYSTRLLLV